MLNQRGGQDEDFYAVPGWTILHTGLPQIPYLPSRDTESVFYNADRILFALPPAYFYWQAVVLKMLGPGYGPARLSSFIVGAIAVILTYGISFRLTKSRRTSFLAALFYGWSRLYFFPATFARPDILCATFGLFALWMVVELKTARWAALAGIAIGLSMLTHPFAIVIVLHILAVCFMRADLVLKQRIILSGIMLGCAGVCFSLWGVLIFQFPEEFRIQFFNNVLDRSGPGLLSRFFWPIESFREQIPIFLELNGIYQASLLSVGLIGAAVIHAANYKTAKRNGSALIHPWLIAAIASYLLIVCQGTHPAKGYWCYPGALLWICVAYTIPTLSERSSNKFLFLGCLTFCLLLPGSGLKAWWLHVSHWNSAKYNHRLFITKIVNDLPTEGRYLADVTCVLDLYLAGLDVTLAQNDPQYFQAVQVPFDYLIVGRPGIEEKLPEQLDTRKVQTWGTRTSPLTEYAELHARK